MQPRPEEDPMTTAGPDFLALQVRDLEAAADFFERHLGLTRTPSAPPGAIEIGRASCRERV